MAIRSSIETINGRTYVVERDADTNALISFRGAPNPPRKERLEDAMRQRAQDLLVWHHMVEQATARGESQAAINELTALETQLYQRVREVYLEWRTA